MSAQPSDPAPGPGSVAAPGWRRPVPPPHPLTVAEYLAIGEVEPGYTELVEGQLMMAPSPAPRHNRAQLRLAGQLASQLPEGLEVLPEIDVDLALSGPDRPGWVRRPDLVVAPRESFERVDREGGAIRAAEVTLVVEILSPGSRRTDHVTKRGEYADAGIGHYWIIDLGEPVSLLACHLAGEFGYADGGVVTGRHTADRPFAADFDLDALG
ncbi:Uma2 family endonuclease [Pseudonocardia sp. NPDC046786]|uniref:Uma2 family endonuclease n=1 Tax=Pseudonocardia sp. NPDC046786 TaxID=3155471 RepID=UPI0033C62AA1